MDEKSKSGQPIHRYEGPGDWESPEYGDEGMSDAIAAHIESFFGKVDNVYHEIVSDKVHIDVHIINPTPEKNYYTLFTTGMSYLPMNAPEEYKKFNRAELITHLPPDWDIKSQEDKDFWPIGWLKFLARFPHKYDTWLFYGHTIPNGEEAEPFAENTGLGCMILGETSLVEDAEDFVEIMIDENTTVYCFTMIPIYAEEMTYKLDNGAAALFEKMQEEGISDIIDVDRVNVCKE